MTPEFQISLLGELRIASRGAELPLPASRKARALLGFLAATGRPHRRERLCELFWDLPDDPKAALRWALSKLRQVVDAPDRPRIIADRERVFLNVEGADVDVRAVHAQLRERGSGLSQLDLEAMATRLQGVFLDGLDGSGDASFDAWLTAEREDARMARAAVLRLLATHPEASALSAQKWTRRWYEEDPLGAEANERAQRAASAPSIDAVERTQPAVDDRPADTRLDALRRQRIGFCEARDGTKIAYATIGSGPPILKAANWLNHVELDWASPIWADTFAEIARANTFIRYDERGCGLSDWDVKAISFDAFVEDLEAVADKLELERFPLIGISQGAAVSIEYAVRHPERVSCLILLGGYAAGWRHTASREEQERRAAVMTLTLHGWGTDNPAYRHIFSRTFMPEATPKELAWFDEFQRQTTSPANAVRFQEAFGHIDVRHRLAQVRVPTIVLHSRHDLRIPLEQGRELASGIPGAQFVPLDSRNHILVDREPAWLDCVQAISRFLRELSP